jgi:hypothetical protein
VPLGKPLKPWQLEVARSSSCRREKPLRRYCPQKKALAVELRSRVQILEIHFRSLFFVCFVVSIACLDFWGNLSI